MADSAALELLIKLKLVQEGDVAAARKALEDMGNSADEAQVKLNKFAQNIAEKKVLSDLGDTMQNVTPKIENATTSLRGMRMAIMGISQETLPGMGRALYGLVGIGGPIGAIIAAEAAVRLLEKAFRDSEEAAKKLNEELSKADFAGAIDARRNALIEFDDKLAEHNDKIAHTVTLETAYQDEMKRSEAVMRARIEATVTMQEAQDKLADSQRKYQEDLFKATNGAQGLNSEGAAADKAQAEMASAKHKADAEAEKERIDLSAAQNAVGNEQQQKADATKQKEETTAAARAEAEKRAGFTIDLRNAIEAHAKLKQAVDDAQSGENTVRQNMTQVQHDPKKTMAEISALVEAMPNMIETHANTELQRSRLAENEKNQRNLELAIHGENKPQEAYNRALESETKATEALAAAKSKLAIETEKAIEAGKAREAALSDSQKKALVDYQDELIRRGIGKTGMTGKDEKDFIDLESLKIRGHYGEMSTDQQSQLVKLEDEARNMGVFNNKLFNIMLRITSKITSQEDKLEATHAAVEMMESRGKSTDLNIH